MINQLNILELAKDCKDLDIDIFDISKYGIIKVYENEGHPALFLKEIEFFDNETLKQIAEIQHICWNFQKVLFLYVYTKTEIRIYNCSQKPFSFNDENRQKVNFDKELQELEIFSCEEKDASKLDTLNTLFSRLAIDTGFIWSSSEAKEIKEKLNLQNRVDKYLIKSLINVSEKLDKEGLKDKDIVHKLVMRSLFLLYLQDKGATTAEFYNTFLDSADSYFKILKSPEATYRLFERLSNDFNGSLFTVSDDERKLVNSKHLELIGKCFINGYEDNNQITLFKDWRLFDFKVIRIELLSEIYENFLSELDKKGKKDSGTFYTPPSLVELILNEKLPIKNNEIEFNVKTLDPSCGSGIFLVQSFKRLVKRYENKYNVKLNDFNILVKILKDNIFGIEIDPKSIKVASFSLYLTLLDNLDPKTSWWNGNVKFPYLINDPEDKTLSKQGFNLFSRDTISDFEIKELQNFQLVVGNPPFGKLFTEDNDIDGKQKNIRFYCEKEDFAKEMVLPFMHKATLLAPKGEIALIFNTKVLTNTGRTYQNFRHWLFNDNYVEKIYNLSVLRKAPENSGGQLFGSAVVPISIIFYKNETPENPNETITYYAPKTYIKNDVLEGIVIDSSDEKHLPRTECEKKDTKIWKIAMWGSYFDFELIKRIESKYKSLEDFIENNKKDWIKGSGIHSPSKVQIEKNKFFIPIETIETGLIDKYYTSKKALLPNSKLYRPTNELLYKSPFLVIKEGQKDKEYCSSIVDFDCYHKAFSVVHANIDFLKVLSSFINSVFTNYYLSLSSSSWGIERERAQSNEMLQLPAIIENMEEESIINISSKFDEIISIKKLDEENSSKTDISHLENQIDQIIYNDILKLTQDEQIIIQDTINYSLDLFEKQENSKAVLPVKEIDVYSKRLTEELNNWLDDVELKASVTHYSIDRNCPLYMVKISFGKEYKLPTLSKEIIYNELKRLDQKLWDEEHQNIYFRKKLNYYDNNDVYIIKPNQRRFWSQTAAMEDCKSLLIEIANG